MYTYGALTRFDPKTRLEIVLSEKPRNYKCLRPIAPYPQAYTARVSYHLHARLEKSCGREIFSKSWNSSLIGRRRVNWLLT